MTPRRRSVCVLLAVAPLLAIGSVWPSVAAAPPDSSGDSVKRIKERANPHAKPFAPDRLLRAFRGTREDVRHKALDEVERHHLDDAKLPAALWQVIEPALKAIPAPDSLLRAILLFVRLENPEAEDHQAALLSAADPRIVMAALDVLAGRRPPSVLEKMTRVREHPAYPANYGLRHAVVSAVAQFSEPASVEFLIGIVAAFDGQLKYVAAGHLARLTGQNFGGKAESWREWWKDNRQGFRVVSPTADAQGAAKTPANPIPWDYDVPQFFGTAIYAKRVVFVIDKSKSMLSSVDGVTRLDDAEKELDAAIHKLPDDAWFEIIAYNDLEQPFRGRLVQATPAEKSAATQFIYALTAEHKTDIYDTLADALVVDPNLEAMLFLSDGDPNLGTIVDRDAIVQKITQQNAARRISVNTVGIDARGPAESFLRRLASLNFGDYRSSR
jgi:hypothetical protein